MWVFEMYQRGMGFWMPIVQGSEEECRTWYDRYMELRPDLEKQINVRNTEENPEPPAAPDLGELEPEEPIDPENPEGVDGSVEE